MGDNDIGNDKNAVESTTISMAMAMQRYDVGRMKHIQGFTWSQWMPPLGKCSHCIATAAAMVNDFE